MLIMTLMKTYVGRNAFILHKLYNVPWIIFEGDLHFVLFEIIFHSCNEPFTRLNKHLSCMFPYAPLGYCRLIQYVHQNTVFDVIEKDSYH